MSWIRKKVTPGAPPAAAAPPAADGSSPAYSCPDCGAALRDTTLRACPYCQAALFSEEGNKTTRVWRTPDGGATWSVLERSCAQCGAMAGDPKATTCGMCGATLPALLPRVDTRPTATILVQLPPVPAAPGKVTVRVQALVRFLDNNWWPVPPSVPRAVAGLLPLLPDTCPQCGSKQFRVALAPPSSWQVVCSGCKSVPGQRTDAPPTFPRPQT